MKAMKKILSVFLAIFLMTATFSVAASAATATETPVGSADTGLTDTEFNDKNSGNQTISVTVKDVQHRYAVDLEFSFEDLTIDSDIVWNVKDLKYDVKDTNLINQERTIKVTNRSDMPVYAYAAAADVDEKDGVTISTSNTSDSRLEVAKATVGTGNTNGNATTGKISVSLASTDWQKVAEYYAAKSIDSIGNNYVKNFKLTTVTVTISKSANAN